MTFDSRSFRRRTLALLLPIGPLCVAALRLILPYGSADSPSAQLAAVANGQGAQSAVLWLTMAAELALIPALFVLTRMAMRRAPVLAMAAITLALPGYLSMAALGAMDAATLAAVTAGLSPASGAALLGELAAQPAMTAGLALFVVGHVLGTVLLGVALLRARAIPVWAAWALIASQPLHLAIVVTSGPAILDGAAWALTALGFAAASLALLRMPDDAYEPHLTPEPSLSRKG